MRLTDGELSLTITEFDSRLDLRALSVGQLDDVRIAATDLRWNGQRFERASAVLHNVHMRASVPPALVAAPVELTLELPAPVLDELFRSAAPRLSGEVGPDGVARLSVARRRGWGHVEVEMRVDGSTLWITPARDRAAPQVGVAAAHARLPRPAARTAPRPLPHLDRPCAPAWCGSPGHLPRMADGGAARPVGGRDQSAQRRRPPAQPDLADTGLTHRLLQSRSWLRVNSPAATRGMSHSATARPRVCGTATTPPACTASPIGSRSCWMRTIPASRTPISRCAADSIRDVLDDQLPQALAMEPDLITICIGMNDVTRPGAIVRPRARRSGLPARQARRIGCDRRHDDVPRSGAHPAGGTPDRGARGRDQRRDPRPRPPGTASGSSTSTARRP